MDRTIEQYLSLFDSASEGIFQCDKKGLFTIMNQSGTEILGFSKPAEVLQKDAKTLGVQVEEETQNELSNHLMNNDKIQNYLIDIKIKNGICKKIELTLHGRKNETGKIIGYDGIFRDVTKQVAMEEELRNYSTNLEKTIQEKTKEVLDLERSKFHLEKLASLGQMAAMIVHDVRNPLSSIKMGLTTLLNRAELKDRDQYCIEIAVREVNHLERILKDLLNFAKPQNLQFANNDINQVLELALEQMVDNFEGADISIEKTLSAQLPLIRIDKDRLSQVFFNLLLNAKQAIINGGIISIRSDMDDQNNIVRVQIQDNGEGIQEEYISQIFDPFYSTKAEGTGLGLSVVQKLIEAHNGTVSIESKLGMGTKVTIELPINDAPS